MQPIVCGRPHAILSKAPKRNTYLKFAEKINGRCAMQGTIWSAAEAITGNHQFDTLYLVGVTGLVALGTAITFDEENEISYSIFTPEAELKNSRLAMIGMAGLSALHLTDLL